MDGLTQKELRDGLLRVEQGWLYAERRSLIAGQELRIEMAGLTQKGAQRQPAKSWARMAFRRKKITNSWLGAGNCNGLFDVEKSSEMTGQS